MEGGKTEKHAEVLPQQSELLIECPTCKNTFSKRAAKCPKCGTERVANCQVCQNLIPASSIVCPKCGDPKPFEGAQDLTTTPNYAATGTNIKHTPVLLTMFFAFITAGIYVPCWFLTRLESLNSLRSKEQLGSGIFIFIIVFYGISLMLNITSGVFEGLSEGMGNVDFLTIASGIQSFDGIMNIIVAFILIFQCFKVKRIFQEHYNDFLGRDIPFSGLATFFFGIFYLQYKINRFN